MAIRVYTRFAIYCFNVTNTDMKQICLQYDRMEVYAELQELSSNDAMRGISQ